LTPSDLLTNACECRILFYLFSSFFALPLPYLPTHSPSTSVLFLSSPTLVLDLLSNPFFKRKSSPPSASWASLSALQRPLGTNLYESARLVSTFPTVNNICPKPPDNVRRPSLVYVSRPSPLRFKTQRTTSHSSFHPRFP